jgi:hypothetical protein
MATSSFTELDRMELLRRHKASYFLILEILTNLRDGEKRNRAVVVIL